MAANSECEYVDLGFAEEQDSWLLTNRYFPSKIGGKVALLDLANIPEANDLACDYCNEPCILLCQIYAGSEKVTHAFHRTIFVFICRNGKCCSLNQSGNIKVLRSQLPLKNQFYPDTPPDESIECEPIPPPSGNLCSVCGCKGPMLCGKCKKAYYCGQVHQKLDWKTHKKLCKRPEDEPQQQQQEETSEILFPEFEIVIEREESAHEKGSESEKEAEKRRLKEFEDMVKCGQAGGGDITEKDLQEFAESKEDKAFGKFKKAIEGNQTQVLRYSRHERPLWISDNATLNPSHIPKCGNCSGRRTFEFQIMPQMLNELKNYELDWGVIAVYTCERDCEVNGKYVQEFCYKQDVIKGDDDDIDTDIKMANMNVDEKEASARAEKDDAEAHTKTKKKSQSKSKKTPVNGSGSGSGQPKKAFQESDDW